MPAKLSFSVTWSFSFIVRGNCKWIWRTLGLELPLLSGYSKNVYFVFYMLVIHVFLTFEIVRFISSGAFWNNCWKFCKNNKRLLWNFLRATITASFSDFASSWRHWFTGRYSPCVAKTVSHTVVPLSPSSPKRSVPNGKPNKLLKINKEVFRLLILPHYTKMLRNPNGHYLSFVKAESMQLLFGGSV